MKLSSCVSCELPVLELTGQFTRLDSLFITAGNPPVETSGDWHVACLRASSIGPAWKTARLRNFVDVRGYQVIAELAEWTVARDPRRGKRLAFANSGELVDLSVGSIAAARQADGGVVLPCREDEFHLELADRDAIKHLHRELTAHKTYPLAGLLATLGIADRIADPIALDGGALYFDRGLAGMWTDRSVSFGIEYGIWIPYALVPHVGERVR